MYCCRRSWMPLPVIFLIVSVSTMFWMRYYIVCLDKFSWQWIIGLPCWTKRIISFVRKYRNIAHLDNRFLCLYILQLMPNTHTQKIMIIGNAKQKLALADALVSIILSHQKDGTEELDMYPRKWYENNVPLLRLIFRQGLPPQRLLLP